MGNKTVQEILTFEQAIDKSGTAKRNLLLGNGFSIACEPSIFHYESLYTQASEKLTREFPEISKLFEKQETSDFENIIHMLQNAGIVVPFYLPSDHDIYNKLLNHENKLKEILINTIAANHPTDPSSISDEKFLACRKFLSHFLSPELKGKVYTLNYDLLLYWTLMHGEKDDPEYIELVKNDGFGKDGSNSDFVTWVNEDYSRDQRVHYLHGAVHLFDNGTELEKYTWINKGKPLIMQVRESLQQNKYPLFVSEGSWEYKLNKIKHQPYLYHSYKSFLSELKEDHHRKEKVKKSLFIYGHSLAKNDLHIIDRIAKGSISNLFISIYDDHRSECNQNIINTALSLKNSREQKKPLEVNFYNAESASVWG